MVEKRKQAIDGEGQGVDHKSLRTVTGKTADFSELAKDCVCFANGSGGDDPGRHRGWGGRATAEAENLG